MRPWLLLPLLAVLATTVSAQTCTTSWAAPVDGTWSDASKWTAGAPDAAATACITVAGTYTVTLDRQQDLAGLDLGGASGTQTLRLARILPTLGSGRVRTNGRLETVAGQGINVVTETLLVEGTLFQASSGRLLGVSGTLDVAPGGQLLVDNGTNSVSIGRGGMSLLRLRGRLTFDPGATTGRNANLYGTVEVDGGTVEVVGNRVQFQSQGTFRNASFEVGPTGDLWIQGGNGSTGVYVLEGTMAGDVEGRMAVYSELQAGDAGATLDLGGTGLEFTGSGARFASAGGAFVNRGLIDFRGWGARGVEVVNRGMLRVSGVSVNLIEGAVLRNETDGTLDLVDQGAFAQSDQTGRVENAGLAVVRLATRTSGTSQFNGRLASEAGSEIRVLAPARLVIGTPDTEVAGPAVALTGDGIVFFSADGLEVEGTVSPGTAPGEISTLAVQGRLRMSRTEGTAQMIVDLGPGGTSDLIDLGTDKAYLGGTVVVRLGLNYTPQVGDVFTVLQSGMDDVEGGLEALEIENPVNGVTFVPRLSPTHSALLLRAVASTDIADDAPAMLALTTLSNPSRRPRLRVGMPDPRPTEVDVFDVRGRRVASLWDGPLASGSHDFTLPDGLPSGLYLVRVLADGEPRTLPLTVVR